MTDIEEAVKEACEARARRGPAPGPALATVTAQTYSRRSGPRLNLPSLWRPVSVGLAMVVVCVGAGLVYRGVSSPETVAAGAGAKIRTCGATPAPKTGKPFTVAVTGPSTVRSGAEASFTAVLTNVSGTVQSVESVGAPADILIVKAGKVVGRYEGASSGIQMAGSVKPSQSRTIPGRVLVSGCPRGSVSFQHPDASRLPLPPGEYAVVAVVGALGTALPSASFPVTVTP